MTTRIRFIGGEPREIVLHKGEHSSDSRLRTRWGEPRCVADIGYASFLVGPSGSGVWPAELRNETRLGESLNLPEVESISYSPDPDPYLTEKDIGHPGCGAGTENACFALTRGPNGWECSLISDPDIVGIAGFGLGWRVNVDPVDSRAWCLRGVLKNSKKP